ncbi:MAG: right-handed parallel beta-helix repeat-containing protein, partial [Planctomycetes bacterium]|nr:right-handed parallel beta-helix repeat-containing protein [Planctomycetota bacterium]
MTHKSQNKLRVTVLAFVTLVSLSAGLLLWFAGDEKPSFPAVKGESAHALDGENREVAGGNEESEPFVVVEMTEETEAAIAALESPQPVEYVPTTSESVPGSVSGLFVPESELTIDGADSLEGVSLYVPAGALSEEAEISLADTGAALPGFDEDLDELYELLSSAISLEPHGIIFNEPVLLSIPLDEELLFNRGYIPETVGVLHRLSNGTIEEAEVAYITDNSITVLLNSFSHVVLVGYKQTVDDAVLTANNYSPGIGEPIDLNIIFDIKGQFSRHIDNTPDQYDVLVETHITSPGGQSRTIESVLPLDINTTNYTEAERNDADHDHDASDDDKDYVHIDLGYSFDGLDQYGVPFSDGVRIQAMALIRKRNYSGNNSPLQPNKVANIIDKNPPLYMFPFLTSDLRRRDDVLTTMLLDPLYISVGPYPAPSIEYVDVFVSQSFPADNYPEFTEISNAIEYLKHNDLWPYQQGENVRVIVDPGVGIFEYERFRVHKAQTSSGYSLAIVSSTNDNYPVTTNSHNPAIQISYSPSITIDHARTIGGDVGIMFNNSPRSYLLNSISEDSFGHGVDALRSEDITIENVSVSNSAGLGVKIVERSVPMTLRGLSITDAGQDGLHLRGVENSEFTDIKVTNSHHGGIDILDIENTIVRRALVTGSGSGGIYVDGRTENVTIESSASYDNNNFAIKLGRSDSIKLLNNTFAGSDGKVVWLANTDDVSFVNTIAYASGNATAVHESNGVGGITYSHSLIFAQPGAELTNMNSAAFPTGFTPGVDGNLNVDPEFVPGTIELSASSPAIDAGIFDPDSGDFDIFGSDRISGTDIDIGAAEFVLVVRVLDHYEITNVQSTYQAGDTANITVTAYDQLGAVYTSYSGADLANLNFDGASSLPDDIDFTAGASNVSLFIDTLGTYDLTVTDNANPAITETIADITIIPGDLDHYDVSGLQVGYVAGDTLEVTVTAYDSLGNVATGYAGPATLTF